MRAQWIVQRDGDGEGQIAENIEHAGESFRQGKQLDGGNSANGNNHEAWNNFLKPGKRRLVCMAADHRLKKAGKNVGGGEHDADLRGAKAAGDEIGDGESADAGHRKEIYCLMQTVQRRKAAAGWMIHRHVFPPKKMVDTNHRILIQHSTILG